MQQAGSSPPALVPRIAMDQVGSTPPSQVGSPTKNSGILFLLDRERGEREQAVASLQLDLQSVTQQMFAVSEKLRDTIALVLEVEQKCLQTDSPRSPVHEQMQVETHDRNAAMETLTANVHETMHKTASALREELLAEMEVLKTSLLSHGGDSAEKKFEKVLDGHMEHIQQLQFQQRYANASIESLNGSLTKAKEREVDINERLDSVKQTGLSLTEEVSILSQRQKMAELRENDMKADIAKGNEVGMYPAPTGDSNCGSPVSSRTKALMGEMQAEVGTIQTGLESIMERVTRQDEFRKTMYERLAEHDNNAESFSDALEEMSARIQTQADAQNAFEETQAAAQKAFEEKADADQAAAAAARALSQPASSVDAVEQSKDAITALLSPVKAAMEQQKQFLQDESTRINSRIDSWAEKSVKQSKELQDELRARVLKAEMKESQVEKEVGGMKLQLAEQIADIKSQLPQQRQVSTRPSPARADAVTLSEGRPSSTPSKQSPPASARNARQTPGATERANGSTTTNGGMTPSKQEMRSPVLTSRELGPGGSEKDEEHARQRFLSRVPVQFRKAISEHKSAQPWINKSWVERLTIAEELLPSLTAAT